MKRALVIHPILSIYMGGELLCLQVCRALLQAGYKVTLYSDTNNPAKADEVYPGMGKVLSECYHVQSSTSHRAIPGIAVIKDFKDIRKTESYFQEIDPDVTFCTQSSPFHVPSRLYHFIYHGTDLFQRSVLRYFLKLQEGFPNTVSYFWQERSQVWRPMHGPLRKEYQRMWSTSRLH